MIVLKSPSDINWQNLSAIAYDEEAVEICDALLAKVDQGRKQFLSLIAQDVPCYGVTTGLGQLVKFDLDENARRDLPHNILRARAAAIGKPFNKSVARAIMVVRLVNFLSAMSGVSSELCCFLTDRLNDGFVPWIPTLGHGMAADAIANTHAFQTFIGEGFIYGPNGERQAAAEALTERGVQACQLAEKEGLALLNGVTAAPAYAFDAHRRLSEALNLANAVAAVSIEGLAAPKDAFDPLLVSLDGEAGVKTIIKALQPYLTGSQVKPAKLQAPISYRVIPQVHGAMSDALYKLRSNIETSLRSFSDNPLMTQDRFLSVGMFHNQHLVNQIEQVALAFAHLGCLSERRLHRLMDAENTGLNAQLAARPGLDAGLVVTQKASLDLAARLRMLAQPVSLLTSESSAGQEDYMSMAIPAIARLYQMIELVEAMLAYELLAALVATRLRDQVCGQAVESLRLYFDELIQPLSRDRPPGPDVELILQQFTLAEFRLLIQSLPGD